MSDADETANAVFHLVIRKNAGHIPFGLFEWVARGSFSRIREPITD